MRRIDRPILYLGMRHDYGDPARGDSFEHANYHDTLAHMGFDIIYFDFHALAREHGRRRMNRMLLETVERETPALVFATLYQEELSSRVMSRISARDDVTTINWFNDDDWRFDSFSRRWAPCFNWVVTTSTDAVERYAACGIHNVIKSQFACNPFLYQPVGQACDLDVSFVGQPHGHRRKIVEQLRGQGIDIKAWGNGWPAGRLTTQQMVEVFSRSRINLNLTGASTPAIAGLHARLLPTFYRMRWWPCGSALQATASKIKAMLPNRRVATSSTADVGPAQIKGRTFEVPGCGGFLLTQAVDGLDEYYTPGSEIAVFRDVDELVEMVRYYLEHEEERARIAEAGYRRTRASHTYVHRFVELFRVAGFDLPDAEHYLTQPDVHGPTEEVH